MLVLYCFSNLLPIQSVLNLLSIPSDSICLCYKGEKKKVKKTKTEKYWDWELANETKPIWVSLRYIYFYGARTLFPCIIFNHSVVVPLLLV